MTTITTTPAQGAPTAEQLLRHLGLYARDLYWLNGDTASHQITGERTTVRRDPEQDAAVFDLDGVALTVPSAALDRVDLIPAQAQEQGPATGEGA